MKNGELKNANDKLTHTKKIKLNKGITLVALIITIIILLILAGITISQLSGDGIFSKAKQAKQKWENAQELENSTLGEYENKLKNYGISKSRDDEVESAAITIKTGEVYTIPEGYHDGTGTVTATNEIKSGSVTIAGGSSSTINTGLSNIRLAVARNGTGSGARVFYYFNGTQFASEGKSSGYSFTINGGSLTINNNASGSYTFDWYATD